MRQSLARASEGTSLALGNISTQNAVRVLNAIAKDTIDGTFILRGAPKHHLENVVAEVYPALEPTVTEALSRYIFNEVGYVLHNHILDHIEKDTWNCWVLDEKADGVLKIDNVGDFRVMQWEEEHLDESGNYHAHAGGNVYDGD